MKHAVILAADGFRPVVEDSLLRLENSGISDIVVVTGEAADQYAALASRYDGLVRLAHNSDHARAGSMHTLHCAREVIDDDFLLLDANLVYEPRALDVLINHEMSDAVLLSVLADSGGELYVETQDGMLVNMSRDRSELGGEVSGQAVGICKISRGLFAIMKRLAEEAFDTSVVYAYDTDCLVAAARHWDIACPVVSGLRWSRADDTA